MLPFAGKTVVGRSPRPGDNTMVGLLPAGLGSFAIKAGALSLQVLIGITLARQLGPEGLGAYAVTMAVVHLTAIGLQCGLGDALVRSIAVARAGAASAQIRAQIAAALRIVGCLALVLIMAGLLMTSFAPRWMQDWPLGEGLVIASVIALTAIVSGAMGGLGHVLWGQVPQQWVRPVLMLAGLTLFMPAGATSAHDALIAYAAASLGGLIVALALLLLVLPAADQCRTVRIDFRLMLAGSLPFLALAGAHILHQQADILMVGLLASQTEVGFYRVAINIGDAFQAVLLALSVVIAPRIALLHGRGDWRGLKQLSASAHRLALIVIGPIAIVTALLAGPIVKSVFGTAFEPAHAAVTIVALGKIAYAAVGFAGLVLAMSGHPGLATAITMAAVVLNVGLNALLIPQFGIAGAATATAVSQFAINAVLLWWLIRGLEHRPVAGVAS